MVQYPLRLKRGHSSFGRAPPCQGGGSEFESRCPLQKFTGIVSGRFRCLLYIPADRLFKNKEKNGKIQAKKSSSRTACFRRRYESPARCAPQNVQKPFRGRGRAFSSLSLYLSLGAVSPLPKMRSSISGPMSTPPCIYEPVYACRGEKFREISNRDPHQRESHETL